MLSQISENQQNLKNNKNRYMCVRVFIAGALAVIFIFSTVLPAGFADVVGMDKDFDQEFADDQGLKINTGDDEDDDWGFGDDGDDDKPEKKKKKKKKKDKTRREARSERREQRKKEMQREDPRRRREASKERRRFERQAEHDDWKRRREERRRKWRDKKRKKHEEWKRKREERKQRWRDKKQKKHDEWKRKREERKRKWREEKQRRHQEWEDKREERKQKWRDKKRQAHEEWKRQREERKRAYQEKKDQAHQDWLKNRYAKRQEWRQKKLDKHREWKEKREAKREAWLDKKREAHEEWKAKRDARRQKWQDKRDRDHQEWLDKRQAKKDKIQAREDAKLQKLKDAQDAKDLARDAREEARDQKEAEIERKAEERKKAREEKQKLTAEERRERSSGDSGSANRGGGGEISYTDDKGNKVTVESTADGKVQTTEHPDGSRESLETKDDGTTIVTTTTAEGETTKVTTSRAEDGSTTVTTETPDGTKETVKTTDNWRKGETTTEVTRETQNGYWQVDTEGKSTWIQQEGTRTTTTTTTTDREGNIKLQETQASNGTVWTRDGDGTVTETHRDPFGDGTTQRIYGADGLVTEVERDGEGNVTSSKTFTSERHINDKGETIVRVYDSEGIMTDYKMNGDGTLQYQHSAEQKGEDRGRDMYLKMKAELGLSTSWDDLPQSDRNGFNAEVDRQAAVAERRAEEARFQQELADLRRAQEARQAAEDKAHREWQAEQRRKLDIKLAEIERERQYHMAQYEKHMAEYARIRGQQAADSNLNSAERDMREYARSKGLDSNNSADHYKLLSTDKEYERLYDAREVAAQAQFDAYARTEKEQAFYDAKAAARQEYGKFSGQAHRELEAEFIDETMSRAAGDEAASWGQYVSIGAGQRHQNAKALHSADFEARRAWRTVELIEQELQKPDLTAAQREVLNELYNREVSEWSGASSYGNSLRNIERVGYAADVAVLATGGLAGVGANTLGKGAVTTTARVLTTPLGKAAANQLATRAPTALTSAATNLAARAGETTLGKAVGNVASQQLVQNMAADAAVGATVDVGVQLYTKGEVDLAQTARSTAAGTAMGGLMNTTMRATAATGRGVNSALSGSPSPSSSSAASAGAVHNVARTGSAAEGPGAALSGAGGSTSLGGKTEAGTLRQPTLNNQGGSSRGGTSLGGKTEAGTLRQPTLDSPSGTNTPAQRDLGFPENTPPSQMTPQQRQAYNDHLAHQQWQQGAPIVDPGSGTLAKPPIADSATALPIGQRSQNLTPQQIDNLFQGGVGRKLTPEEALLKADVIASGRTPQWARNQNPEFGAAAHESVPWVDAGGNQVPSPFKGRAANATPNNPGSQLAPPPGFSGNKTLGGETLPGGTSANQSAASAAGAQSKLQPPPGFSGNKTLGGETVAGAVPVAQAGTGSTAASGASKTASSSSNAAGSSAGASQTPVKKSGFFSNLFGSKSDVSSAAANKSASNTSGQSSGSGASGSSKSVDSDAAALGGAGGVPLGANKGSALGGNKGTPINANQPKKLPLPGEGKTPINNAQAEKPRVKVTDPEIDPTLKRHSIDEVDPKWRADAGDAQTRLKQWEAMPPGERKAYVDEVIGFIDEAAKLGDKWAQRYMADYRAGKLDLTFEPQLSPQFHGLNSGNKMRLNPFDANGNLRPAHELGAVALHEGVHNGLGGKAGLNEARAHFAQYAALHRYMKRNPNTQLSGTIKEQYDAFLSGLEGGKGGFGARTEVKTAFTDGFYGQNYQDNAKLITKTSSWKGGNEAKIRADFDAAYGRLDPADRAAFDQMMTDLRQQGKHGDAVREAENMMQRDQPARQAELKQERLNELIAEVENTVDADLAEAARQHAKAKREGDIDAMLDALDQAIAGN